VAAESPDPKALSAELLGRAQSAFDQAAENGFTNERVGLLYAKLYWMFMSSDQQEGPWAIDTPMPFNCGHLADADFRTDRLDAQNSDNDWPMTGDGTASPLGLFVIAPKNRAEALTALHAISLQGEGLTAPTNEDDDSHFERFLRTWETVAKAIPPLPVFKQPIDPTYGDDVLPDSKEEESRITHPSAKLWARLSDVHYAMLIHQIALTLVLPFKPDADDTDPVLTARQALCSHAVTFQMRATLGACQLRLSELPLKAGGSVAEGVGAMPFSSPCMPALADRQALVASTRLLLQNSADIIAEFLANNDADISHPELPKIATRNGKLTDILNTISAL
jgi:hypothetical protein